MHIRFLIIHNLCHCLRGYTCVFLANSEYKLQSQYADFERAEIRSSHTQSKVSGSSVAFGHDKIINYKLVFIHPSTAYLSLSWQCKQTPRPPLSWPICPDLQGDTKIFLKQPKDGIFPLCLGSASGEGIPETPHPGSILVRSPDHLNCLLSLWRSSGSTPSPSGVMELLILFQRLIPDTL